MKSKTVDDHIADYKKLIIAQAKERAEIYQEIDGAYYYAPAGAIYGGMTSFQLRTLADELDRLNSHETIHHTPS